MSKKCIIDYKSMYECLQFLPRIIVNGDDMVSLEDVLNFLDRFPKTQVSENVNISLESNYKVD